MASDLSEIVKSEISNTLESLLSVTASITQTAKVTSDDLSGQQCICVDVDYEFSQLSTKWSFYAPTAAATKFEFLMLGGIGDLKEVIDDEIADAVNEIVSNICGSASTNINAQGFADLGGAKFTVTSNEIIQCEDNSSIDNMFKIVLSLDGEDLVLFMKFEEAFLPFISLIATGVSSSSDSVDIVSSGGEQSSDSGGGNSAIMSLLGEESVDNLKLLFDIKLKLSVRLGTKTFLLRDIISWDTGVIIEMEQMVNEPLDILVNGVKIGEGEAVIVDGKFGIKIKHIGDRRLG